MTVSSKSRPAGLRHIHLELAREKGHPEGERNHGYDLLAPLTQEGRLDPAQWKIDPKACRVRRFRPDQADEIGQLGRKPGGQWFFDYPPTKTDDEDGIRFGEERFVAGEYVSIREADDTMHTFKVVSVMPL